MYLGIEIGGTKLQLAIGRGDGEPPQQLVRREVDAALGAGGILEQIEREAAALLQRQPVTSVGIGFGGPCDSLSGVVATSHQITGWDDFPLGEWIQRTLQLPCRVVNDCDAAALAEARLGAGRTAGSVFYVTVGTGVGGGFVVDGVLFGAGRPAVAEIGHLRPGLHADRPESTVESLASGWGIAAHLQRRLAGDIAHPLDLAPHRSRLHGSFSEHLECRGEISEEYAADLLARSGGEIEQLTTKIAAQAAAEGNAAAADVIARGVEALGWAIAQTITLLAPEIVVVGGGVSLMGDQLFMSPLREQVDRYVFGPLRGQYRLEPAALGELVVVHGALLVAQTVE